MPFYIAVGPNVHVPRLVLKDEVATAMRLCGLASLDEADPGFVNTAELDLLVARGFGHPYARKHATKRRPYRL